MEPFPSDLGAQPSFQRLCTLEGLRFGRTGSLLSASGSHTAEVTALIMLSLMGAETFPKGGSSKYSPEMLAPSFPLSLLLLIPRPPLQTLLQRSFSSPHEIMMAAVSLCWK